MRYPFASCSPDEVDRVSTVVTAAACNDPADGHTQLAGFLLAVASLISVLPNPEELLTAATSELQRLGEEAIDMGGLDEALRDGADMHRERLN
jgi:hypothetical protein